MTTEERKQLTKEVVGAAAISAIDFYVGEIVKGLEARGELEMLRNLDAAKQVIRVLVPIFGDESTKLLKVTFEWGDVPADAQMVPMAGSPWTKPN